MKKFFQNLALNIFNSFTGKSLIFHVSAIVSTYLIVLSGLDWAYYKFFSSPSMQVFLFPAVIIGGFAFLVLILVPLSIGLFKKDKRLVNISFAIMQAEGIGWILSSIYKTFTGRENPPNLDFHFGFMNGGIFWGWPSGHSTVAFAVGVTLFLIFQKTKFRYLALVFAFYVAFGVSTNIHWLSDAVAGAFFGTAIGICVWKSFRNEV